MVLIIMAQAVFAPVDRISLLSPSLNFLDQTQAVIPKIMDFRGVAKISDNEYILAGGMEENQTVTNRVIKITIDDLSFVQNPSFEAISIFPNPVSDILSIQIQGDFQASIFNLQGKLIQEIPIVTNQQIDVTTLPKGVYVLHVVKDQETIGVERFIKQ